MIRFVIGTLLSMLVLNCAVSQDPAAAQTRTRLESIAKEINLLSPEEGGQPILVLNTSWLKPVTGKGDEPADVSLADEAIYAFKDEEPATFSKIAVLINGADDRNVKEFELLAADDWRGEFRSVGKFTTLNALLVKSPYQEFAFEPTKARYVKIRLLSNWVTVAMP